MAESTLGYTDGAGKNIHTFARSIGGTTKEDQVWLPGEHYLPTYSFTATGVATTTSASHLFFVQGDGTNYLRIHSIVVGQMALAGAAATALLSVIRTTTAGSGGSAVSGRAYDEGDTNPYAGTAQTLPSSKGTEGVTLLVGHLALAAAQPMTTANIWEWHHDVNGKPIIIAPAVTNGICIKITTGVATSTVYVQVEATNSTYL